MKRLCIVSLYPPLETYSHKQSGTASVCANLVEALYKIRSDIFVDVLAEKNGGTTPKQQSNSISPLLNIKRVWKRNSISSLIFLTIRLTTGKYDRYLFQYEWSTFGSSILFNIIFLFMLLPLRLLKKDVFIVMHGVIVDKKTIKALIDQKVMSPVSGRIFSLLNPIFYKIISILSKKFIVFEEVLKQNLVNFANISSSKVDVIPHGVDTTLARITKKRARTKLKLPPDVKMLGFFGFVTPYKGPDRLLSLFKNCKFTSKTHLYFIGGKSTHNTNVWYDTFFKNFRNEIANSARVELTGYVDQKEMELYMTACDVLICPHVVMISSSGPLSLAFTFGKPVLLSTNLSRYMMSKDFSKAMRENHIKASELFFDNSPIRFKKILKNVTKNNEKFEAFSKYMSNIRSWENIGKQYIASLEL